jgi:hypothetical protein
MGYESDVHPLRPSERRELEEECVVTVVYSSRANTHNTHLTHLTWGIHVLTTGHTSYIQCTSHPDKRPALWDRTPCQLPRLGTDAADERVQQPGCFFLTFKVDSG